MRVGRDRWRVSIWRTLLSGTSMGPRVVQRRFSVVRPQGLFGVLALSNGAVQPF